MTFHKKIILSAVLVSVVLQLIYIYKIVTLGWFLPDDAYYYFSLARNVAEGNGPKVDTYNNTTGFQPLWGGVTALVYTVLPNNTMAISTLQLISLIAGLATAWFLYHWMVDLGLPTLAITLTLCWWLLSPQTMLNVLNGMETSLALVTVVAVYYSLKFERAWLTGVLCGLAMLARTDAVVLIISVSLVWLYQKQAGRVAVIWLSMLFAAVPWYVFTQSINKPLMPESGQAVRALTLYFDGLPYITRLESLWLYPDFHWKQLISFASFIGWNTLAFYPFSLYLPLGAPLTVLGIILVAIHYRRLAVVAIFVLHTLGLITAYGLFVGDWFHFRYAVPMGTLLTALLIGLFYQTVTQRHVRITFAIFVSAGVIVMQLLFNPLLGRYGGGLSLTSLGDSFYASTLWLNKNVSPTTKVGAFQAGVVSFYGDFSVINLDGKVNSDAYHALQEQRMWHYICEEKIEYLVDWPSMVDDLLINRSTTWRGGNVTEVRQEHEVSIYAIELSQCP